MNRDFRTLSATERKEIVDLYEGGNKISVISRLHAIARFAVCKILKLAKVYQKNKFLDLTGKTFGYLKVIGMTTVREKRRERNRTMAICQCSNCNNTKHLVSPNNLKTGRAISCGCYKEHYKNITGKKNKVFTGAGEMRGTYWCRLKKGAERRGIQFDLTINDAWGLYEKQGRLCALTGLPIYFGRVTYNKETTASLDRIDSMKGYTIDNVQWVYQNVNGMKMGFSQEYFVNFCRMIAKNPDLSYVKDLSQEEILAKREDYKMNKAKRIKDC